MSNAYSQPYEQAVDFAIFVPAFLCKHRSDDPLRDVEVGSRIIYSAAIDEALKYKSARVVEAWQGQDGLYHYGRVLHEHGAYLKPWGRPVEKFEQVGGHRRA